MTHGVVVTCLWNTETHNLSHIADTEIVCWLALEDDTRGRHDLSLKHCVTDNLSYIADAQKLSADWQSSHCLLSLSACVILSNAFALKKSPLSDSHCSVCCYFSPGVRREEMNENHFSRHQWVRQHLSQDSLLRTVNSKGLEGSCWWPGYIFHLKGDLFHRLFARTHRIRSIQLCTFLGNQVCFLSLESLANDLLDLHRWGQGDSRD